MFSFRKYKLETQSVYELVTQYNSLVRISENNLDKIVTIDDKPQKLPTLEHEIKSGGIKTSVLESVGIDISKNFYSIANFLQTNIETLSLKFLEL